MDLDLGFTSRGAKAKEHRSQRTVEESVDLSFVQFGGKVTKIGLI